MALQAAGGFATFGVTDGAQTRDISEVLADAIYYDLHLAGNLNLDFANPAQDTTHYWNEDLLNADTATVTPSVTSTATTINVTAGQGLRFHVGDLIYNTVAGSTEIIQVTGIATDALTVVRAYNSTVAASIADLATVAIIRAEQEGSDIGADKSLSPTVRSNFTHILAGAYDLKVTGSQLARKMATAQMQDFVARQLANRAIELKIGMTRAILYSEKSASAGSASVYRSMAGLRNWIRDNSGVTDSATSALSYTNLNSYNKLVVDKGVFPDLLVIGTDLVTSVAGYDSRNRRMLESDRVAGYTVQEVLLGQGNSVRVVVDSRVKAGDAFLLSSERIRAMPLNGRGMFVIAAVDFSDAKKRRVLAEWTLEVRNPEAQAFLSNKT
jgi:hypothetical protein